jgi:Contractile injection system tube protein/LysM domain
MAETDNVIRAELRELKSDGKETGLRVPVQFNPETLKVSFANQLEAKGDQGGTSTTQYVGKGTTKLSVQLWFDVTGPERQGQKSVKDVRDLTKQVVYFITPKEAPDDKTKVVPPGIRFLWGSFKFDGIMESLEESLEFFSPEGRPLRASVSLSLSQQKIEFLQAAAKDPAGAGGKPPAGTKPLAEAAIGDTMQGLASGLGKAQDWQKIAAANGIENPRMLRPGQLINMNPFGKS